jgi:hypothetical protein
MPHQTANPEHETAQASDEQIARNIAESVFNEPNATMWTHPELPEQIGLYEAQLAQICLQAITAAKQQPAPAAEQEWMHNATVEICELIQPKDYGETGVHIREIIRQHAPPPEQEKPVEESVEQIVDDCMFVLRQLIRGERQGSSEDALRRAITRALASASSPSDDTKRIEWLESNAKRVFFQPHEQDCVIIDTKAIKRPEPQPWGKTLRAAIDAAMASPSEGKGDA